MLARSLRYFLAIAEHRSFTLAARALFVSQPALSQQIRALEAQLGATLFDRSGKHTRLTEAGETFFDHAQQAVQALQRGKQALNEIADLSRGHLRIALTPTFNAWLTGPLIAQWHRCWPNITLSIDEMPQEEVHQSLRMQQADVGIAFDHCNDSALTQTAFYEETLSLLVGKAHPLSRESTVDLSTLQTTPLVLLNQTFASRLAIDAAFARHAIAPPVAIAVNSVQAALEIVHHSSLATLLPQQIALQAGLHAVSLRQVLPTRTAVLLTDKQRHESPAVQAFRQLLLTDFCLPDRS